MFEISRDSWIIKFIHAMRFYRNSWHREIYPSNICSLIRHFIWSIVKIPLVATIVAAAITSWFYLAELLFGINTFISEKWLPSQDASVIIILPIVTFAMLFAVQVVFVSRFLSSKTAEFFGKRRAKIRRDSEKAEDDWFRMFFGDHYHNDLAYYDYTTRIEKIDYMWRRWQEEQRYRPRPKSGFYTIARSIHRGISSFVSLLVSWGEDLHNKTCSFIKYK